MALTEQELRTLDYEPDAGGHFGDYGGRYVSETLMAALSELDQNYQMLVASILQWRMQALRH